MTVPEAFLIVVDDVISMYLLDPPYMYSCTSIRQLLHTSIYRLSRSVTWYRSVMRNGSETVIRTIARACPEEFIS